MADLTFMLGAGDFYSLARQYFSASGSMIADAQSLEDVIAQLTATNTEQTTINLVTAPHGFAALDCPLSVADQANGRRTTTEDDLRAALAASTLAPPNASVITASSRVVIYGSDVGRSTSFLVLLSGLFGNPGELLAPRRLGVFQLVGGSSVYRQARTWSVVQKAPIGDEPPDGWPAFRTAFVSDVTDRFDGGDDLTSLLTTAVDGATTAPAASFFLEQSADLITAQPRANGDAVTAAAPSDADIDDTTHVTSISDGDAYPQAGKLVITVAVLAQVIAGDVAIAEGAGYRRMTSSEGLAPPLASDTGAAGQSFDDAIQALAAEMLAAGAASADVDAFLAAIPRGDADAGFDDSGDSAAEPT